MYVRKQKNPCASCAGVLFFYVIIKENTIGTAGSINAPCGFFRELLGITVTESFFRDFSDMPMAICRRWRKRIWKRLSHRQSQLLFPHLLSSAEFAGAIFLRTTACDSGYIFWEKHRNAFCRFYINTVG